MRILIVAKSVLVACFKYPKNAFLATRKFWLPAYLYMSVYDIKQFLIAARKHGFSKQAALRFFYVTLNCYSGKDLLIRIGSDHFCAQNKEQVYIASLAGVSLKIYNQSKRRQEKLAKVAKKIDKTLGMGNVGRVTFHQFEPEKIFDPTNFNRLDSSSTILMEKKWADFTAFTKKFNNNQLPFGVVTEEPMQKPVGFISEGSKRVIKTNKVVDNRRID